MSDFRTIFHPKHNNLGFWTETKMYDLFKPPPINYSTRNASKNDAVVKNLKNRQAR